MIDYLYDAYVIFWIFVLYSFIGWLIEVMASLINKRKFVNRGFLIGPIVPIWGIGGVIITVLLRNCDIFGTIIMSAILGTCLEYIVNFFMERMFKARWWDYSHLPFNLNGRIWIGSFILFGILGILVAHVLSPIFVDIIGDFNKKLVIFVGIIVCFLVVIDCVLSFTIIKNLKLSLDDVCKDNTVEISKMVMNKVSEKSKSFKRILQAFPNAIFYERFKKNKTE